MMKRQQHRVQVDQLCDERAAEDGTRVLVDRLWPRGLTKQGVDLSEWCKRVAPSSVLRKRYGHDPHRFAEFSRCYLQELEVPGRVERLLYFRELSQQRALTVLTAAPHVEISAAAVLADVLAAGSAG
jgi:uncharacterized protein YeaO (DUF488 family)